MLLLFEEYFTQDKCLSSDIPIMPKMQTEAHAWSCTMPYTDTVWLQPKLAGADKIPLSDLVKMWSVLKLYHTDRWMDQHDKTNRQICCEYARNQTFPRV